MSKYDKDRNSELKMYIIVNSDLAMDKGKIAAQVGHGVAAVIRYMERNGGTSKTMTRQDYDRWTDGYETKIVLRATEDTLLRLAGAYPRKTGHVFCIPILDAGRTQVAEGSLTVVAFSPLAESEVPAEIKKLKLL